jgi:hypothetical protein
VKVVNEDGEPASDQRHPSSPVLRHAMTPRVDGIFFGQLMVATRKPLDMQSASSALQCGNRQGSRSTHDRASMRRALCAAFA